jgi:serine/threonine-protein phosphatase CPPED1
MVNQRRWVFPRIVLVVSVFCLVVLAGTGFAGDNVSLPARQWNRENLDKIKNIKAEPLTFAVLGDSRDNPADFGRVLKMIERDPSPAFVIHLGDMVKEANLEQYQTFFTVERQNLHKPLLAVIGNHELYGQQGPELYGEIFGPDYYAFQINQHYFIIVNDAAKGGLSPEQFRWLENELQKSQKYQTRLVFLHIPLYDPREGEQKPHSLKPEEAARLLALFKKYRVSHVFAGHIHDYYAGDWQGLPYTITGGAGAPLYGNDPQHAFYHYAKVTIRGNKVEVELRRLVNQGAQ